MAYKILIADGKIWRKDCGAIQKEQLLRILKAIRKLEKDPWDGNIQAKQLKHYKLADFRLRVGDYRVLFNKEEGEKSIVLLRVLHRSKLY